MFADLFQLLQGTEGRVERFKDRRFRYEGRSKEVTQLILYYTSVFFISSVPLVSVFLRENIPHL